MIAWPFRAKRLFESRAHRFRPLPLRFVATLPPKQFFGGYDQLRAREQIEALRNLGAVVYEFDTAAVYNRDKAKIEEQKREVVEFHADAAIGTPHAGYLVQGCMLDERTDRSPSHARNLLIDELELPVVLYWDHAITQAAHYLLHPWPRRPSESQRGAVGRLKELFAHPNAVHLFADSGHPQELDRLGIGTFNEATWYVQAVGRAFARAGSRGDGEETFDDEVAFFGNIYLAGSSKIPYLDDSALMRLRDQAEAACAADWRLSAYQGYSQAIAALQPDARGALRLVPDESFFWRFLFDEMSIFMNGEFRLRVVQSCGREFTCVGNFNDPETNALLAGRCRLRDPMPYDGTLARAVRRTRITIDVVNAPFINGFSPKLLDCFAAGGFALTNRRMDISRAIGALADEICCNSADDLAGKLEFFLGHDRRRLEVSREIGALARRMYSGEAVFSQTLPLALERLKVH